MKRVFLAMVLVTTTALPANAADHKQIVRELPNGNTVHLNRGKGWRSRVVFDSQGNAIKWTSSARKADGSWTAPVHRPGARRQWNRNH